MHKEAVNHRLEMSQWESIVIGIERSLIPVIRELAGQLIPWSVSVLVTRIWILSHKRIDVSTLEILVRANNLVGVL